MTPKIGTHRRHFADTNRRLNFCPRQLECHDSSGFTLIEILIAAMMLSFVFTMLFVSYRQLIGDAQALAQKNAFTEMTASALHHVSADLASAFILLPPFYRPPGIHDSGASVYRFTGTTASMAGSTFADIRFVSGRHIDVSGTGGEGYAVIRYYVDGDRQNGFRLMRRDRLVAFADTDTTESAPDPVVCEQVHRFDITYIDADGDPHDAWDSEAESFGYGTPTAVKIVLEVGGPDGETMTLSTTTTLNTIRKETGIDGQ